MKITICGSMSFAKEMVEIKNKLEKLGHSILLPENTTEYADGIRILTVEPLLNKGDLIINHYERIKSSHAILAVNITKNGIENYVGISAFMEIAFAFVMNKKIFLLNSIPEMIYYDEITAMKPEILNGDLSKILQ